MAKAICALHLHFVARPWPRDANVANYLMSKTTKNGILLLLLLPCFLLSIAQLFYSEIHHFEGDKSKEEFAYFTIWIMSTIVCRVKWINHLSLFGFLWFSLFFVIPYFWFLQALLLPISAMRWSFVLWMVALWPRFGAPISWIFERLFTL